MYGDIIRMYDDIVRMYGDTLSMNSIPYYGYNSIQ